MNTGEPDDGWSSPQLYGSPIPMPSDGPSFAVAAAEGAANFVPVGARSDSEPWSPPIYHGPRRHRPRIAEVVDDGPDLDNLEQPDPAASQDLEGLDDLERVPEATSEQAGASAELAAGPSLMASSRTMAIASLASRVTGFLRSLVLVAALGVGLSELADAYNLANTLPNMVYELLLGGVLTSVIIPVLVTAQQRDPDQGVGYTQRLLSIATASLGTATILAVLAAPLLAAIFGGSATKRSLTSVWATLLLPEIFFYGLGAMFTAVLNTRHVYGWPAWAPVLNNLITIAAVGLFALLPGASPLTSSSINNAQILVLGLGTTLGIAGQALVLLIPLRKSGFVWKWRFRASPNEVGRMSEFRVLTQWVLGYVAISQVGVFVVNRVANRRQGGPTTFANADLLFQVPYGILGVSLLTALMPRMSRAAAQGNTRLVLQDLRLGARLSAVALVPITAGLIALGPAFTSVIFLGHATLADARLIGVALAAGAFGLLPFALVMLQQRVFYAVRDARTPTLINLVMVTTKVILVLVLGSVLHGSAIIIALTVSTSTSYLLGSLAGHLLLRRRFGRLGFGSVARTIGWISLASAFGGGVALAVSLGGNAVLGISRGSGVLEVVLGGALGLLVLAAAVRRMPLPEVAEILATARGRRRGGAAPSA
jgi:putative peptidoglycan lipid II flippase